MTPSTPRTTLVDLGRALARVDGVLDENEPVHGVRWRHQAVAFHVDHAAAHLAAWEAGDRTEDHLGHAATRCLFALTLAAELETER